MSNFGDIAPFEWPTESKIVYACGSGFGSLIGTPSVYQKLSTSTATQNFESKVEKIEEPVPPAEEKKQSVEETSKTEEEALVKEQEKADEWVGVESKKRRLF